MTKFEELVEKLEELFELDKADLDFGIHRIIKSRHGEIMRYLKGASGYTGPTLKKKVVEVLGELQVASTEDEQTELKAQIIADYGRRAFNEAGELINEEALAHAFGQRWTQLAEDPATAGARSLEQLEAEVYSHLHAFFSRYYEEADFISLRRTRAGAKPYAIPYSGEEVMLHWANKDQYYIKSTEDLKDYTFTVEEMGTPYRVHFKCARMEAVQNNNKAARAFVLDEEAEIQVDGDALIIPFYFKIFDKKPTEKQQVEALDTALTTALDNNWKTRLNQNDTSFTGTGSRTLLQKHLHNYTRKNTSDYFIHKDLGGFLRQELDFYVKNEVMYLDDVDNRPPEYLTAEIRKIKAIRAVAKDLIAFLAQFEDFQKKLWLKKKFVTESHYCITLDRIIENAPELLPEIVANDVQRKEWVSLYKIDEIVAEELGQIAYAEPLTADFLKANPYLMVDTALYPAAFKLKLLEAIEDIDAQCDGLMANGDNYQALNFLQESYGEQIKCIYIDPPYNTDASEIIYKNGYKNSSWLSMIESRIGLSISLLNKNGMLCLTIDDFEFHRARALLETRFGKDNFLGVVSIKNNPSGRSTAKGFSISHEYGVFYSKNTSTSIGRLKHSENQASRYKFKDERGAFEWVNFRKHGGANANRRARRKLFYPIFVSEETGVRFPEMIWQESTKEWELSESPKSHENVVYPIDGKGAEKTWKWGIESARAEPKEFSVRKDQSGELGVYKKARINSEGTLPLTTWDKKEYSATEYGTNLLKRIFGESEKFSFPKSFHAVTDSLRVANLEFSDIALDYFAGSGTTGHAVINLNREDDGNRKYILVEMGEYFDTVTKPRIQKVVYSPDWKDGKPTRRDGGISHCFKYLRLESYEDTLNNLSLADRSTDLLGLPSSVQEDYLIHYMLDVETRESLVNLQRFEDPWGSILKIHDRESGEAKPKVIDLVETFNYLLGLRVREQKVKDGFLTIEGENPAGETVLIIWRKLSGESDWPTTDNADLGTFLARNLRINPADTEYAAIYINSDTTLEDPHKKILLTEQVFHQLMFADAD